MCSIITTADGSHTIHHINDPESYHSNHGAIQESQHVFIDSGLYFFEQSSFNELTILEIGFGTGLNAFLTLINTLSCGVYYTAFEPFPLAFDLWSQLNYPAQLSCSNDLFVQLHSAAWDQDVSITNQFMLCKRKDVFSVDTVMNARFDLIYFDPFSPNIAPDLWTTSVFQTLFDQMTDHAVLVTYCAKGIVKTRLREVGFSVERLQGPPGKHHMVRARK